MNDGLPILHCPVHKVRMVQIGTDTPELRFECPLCMEHHDFLVMQQKGVKIMNPLVVALIGNLVVLGVVCWMGWKKDRVDNRCRKDD